MTDRDPRKKSRSTLVGMLALLAAGVMADTLYLSTGALGVPWWTLLGGGATVIAFLVRRFVETSIMRT